MIRWQDSVAFVMLMGIATIGLVQGEKADFPDSYCYWKAAQGFPFLQVYTMSLQVNDSTVVEQQVPQGWLYSDWLIPVFRPLSWTNFKVASRAMYLVNLAALSYLVWRLMRVTRHGWIVLAVASFPLCWFLGASNVGLLLLAMAVNPWTAALACAVKPQYCVFVGLHLWLAARTMADDSGASFAASIRRRVSDVLGAADGNSVERVGPLDA